MSHMSLRGISRVNHPPTMSPTQKRSKAMWWNMNTETSHQVTVAERDRLRRRQHLCRERRERQQRKERLHKGATLPLFKNSSKEGATLYVDWRNCVNEMITEKVDEDRVWSLVMQSLEGPPKDTARLAFKKGKGTLKDILKALDKLYGRSASYVHLQSGNVQYPAIVQGVGPGLL